MYACDIVRCLQGCCLMQHADYKFLSTVYRTPALAVLMMSVPPSKCTFSTPRKKLSYYYICAASSSVIPFDRYRSRTQRMSRTQFFSSRIESGQFSIFNLTNTLMSHVMCTGMCTAFRSIIIMHTTYYILPCRTLQTARLKD